MEYYNLLLHCIALPYFLHSGPPATSEKMFCSLLKEAIPFFH